MLTHKLVRGFLVSRFPRPRSRRALSLCLGASLLAVSCKGSVETGDPPAPGAQAGTGGAVSDPAKPTGPGGVSTDPTVDDPTPQPPRFSAIAPQSYLAKVKGALVGVPPTAEELGALNADKNKLAGLVNAWMDRPEFRDKMLAFFRNSFQQSQVTVGLLNDAMATNLDMNEQFSALLLKNIMESFPRTVWQLVSDNRPFNEAVTTRSFMMTPPMLSYMAALDNTYVTDQRKVTDRLRSDTVLNFHFALDKRDVPIPIEATLDPASPDYMVWNDGSLYPDVWPADCLETKPRLYNKEKKNNNSNTLFSVIWGKMTGPCQKATQRFPSYFAEAEFDDWKMVTVRAPAAGEAQTAFYDLPKLRTTKELVVRTPRVGFFSTPAFFANWATNESNQARVTINQTLIVALGRSFDGLDTVVPVSENGLAAEHAAPGTECYGCHRTLDPMRQYFRQAFTLFYHEQMDAKELANNGTFAFDGVTKAGSGLGDLAESLAKHPRFATAWVQKLCTYANSTVCDESDPEFTRIVKVFRDSNLNFKTLVKTLFVSPLVTGAAKTASFEQAGMTVSIVRRDAFCWGISARLGLEDVCGLNAKAPTAVQKRLRGFANLIPSDGYTRGAEFTPAPNDPDMFFRETTEKMCRLLGDQVVDAPAMAPKYSSKTVDPALDDMVASVMMLPAGDSRAVGARKILREHYDGVIKAGGKPVEALKSTFVLSCMSPTSVLVGL